MFEKVRLWLVRRLKRKVLRYAFASARGYIRAFGADDLKRLDTYIDNFIMEAIPDSLWWLEKLILGLEQVMLDEIMVKYLPEVKAFILSRIDDLTRDGITTIDNVTNGLRRSEAIEKLRISEE